MPTPYLTATEAQILNDYSLDQDLDDYAAPFNYHESADQNDLAVLTQNYAATLRELVSIQAERWPPVGAVPVAMRPGYQRTLIVSLKCTNDRIDHLVGV